MLLLIIFIILAFCFGFVILFGPPYLPTLKPQIESAFELLDLKPGQTIIELGSGDGKVLIYAAKKGFKVIGYELNPLLYFLSLIRTYKYRKDVKIYCANFWQVDWPKSDAIFTFLLNRQMLKLDKRINSNAHKPIKLASFAFKIPGKKIHKEKNGVFLYEYK
ncbi:MAG: hypothetical protein WCI60_01270 [bacterium]